MKRTTPLVVLHAPPQPPALRLLCFHHAGGTDQAYRTWPQHLTTLPIPVEFMAVTLPGRGRRYGEEFAASLPQAAREVVAALEDVRATSPPVPTIAFGHSLGAMLAYETAWQWEQRRGQKLSGVIVSGCAPPGQREVSEAIATRSDEALVEWLREKEGTPPELLENVEMMEIALPILRADLRLIQGYSPGQRPPLDAPITAIAGREDGEVLSYLSGWRPWTRGSFDAHSLPGGHFYLQEDEATFLSWLRQQLLASTPSA